MILNEYLQKHNRPKARFSEREAPDGGWICKVVLPDPRKPDSDVVIWMDDSQNSKDDAVSGVTTRSIAHERQLCPGSFLASSSQPPRRFSTRRSTRSPASPSTCLFSASCHRECLLCNHRSLRAAQNRLASPNTEALRLLSPRCPSSVQ